MEAKQLVQALPQILKENLGWFEATRLARHLRNFGADVEIRTAAAKLYMSIIGNLNNRDRIRLSELVKLLLANLGWCKCVAAFSY
jgi:hypothetical protein